jgi:Calcineurin-like phosphoesterase
MPQWSGSEQVRRLTSYLRAHRPRSWWHAAGVGLAYLLGWAVIAVPVAYHAFMTDERATVIAGHDVVVSPTRDGWATFDLGALLPDVRYPTDRTLGVTVDVGATKLDDYNALIQRYAVIASQPEGEVAKVSELLTDMAFDAMAFGAVVGLAGPALWLLLGPRRRRELLRALTTRRTLAAGVVVAVVVGVTASRPFEDNRAEDSVAGSNTWQPIGELIPETRFSGQEARLEVQGGLITSGTKTLIQSAFDTYDTSLTFYRDLAGRAATIGPLLRQPADDETVALFVTDRHDNVGMDKVARTIGDAGGASVLFDGGDDTSTGEAWEAFSLDSLTKTFDDYDQKYAVAGNHDNGRFVSDYLADRGVTMLTGEPIKAADGIRLLGAPDPRSSGLGSWKTITGATFDEQAQSLADAACAADEDGKRVSTVLVHDANLGRPALERGCVDLVLAGHLHLQVGPDEVVGENGRTGTTYTNGTTGGAAYAFALGSKLRRDAEVSLVTFRDGVAIGLQPVAIRTNGEIVVKDFTDLPLGSTRSDSVGN